jgi:hypothetical protein
MALRVGWGGDTPLAEWVTLGAALGLALGAIAKHYSGKQ